MNALFAFDDPAAARRVRERLLGLGFAEDDLTLHAPDPNPDARIVDAADELVTGGMGRNLQHLLEGLFEAEAVDQDASAFHQTLQQGGAVLQVHAATAQAKDAVDAVLRDSGFSRRTAWSGPPSR